MTITIALTGSVQVTPVYTAPGGPSVPLLVDDAQHLPAGIYLTGSGTLLTGHQAGDHATVDPTRWIGNPITRLGDPAVDIGGQMLEPVDLVAAIIRRCMAETHAATGQPAARLQLVIPADWGPRRCTLLRQAAAGAGVADVLLVAAPVAVARYATLTIGLEVPVGGLLAVVDTDTSSCSVLTRLDDRDWDILSTITPPNASTAGTSATQMNNNGQPAGTDQPPAVELAGVVAAAISAADIEPATLSAIACAGAPTVPTGLDAALADTVGVHPVLLARPTQAAALGAAQHLPQQSPTAAWAPVPATHLGLRHVLALAGCGILSLILIAHTLASTYINGDGIHVDYVLINRGELALACLLAVLTCLGAGRALTLIRVTALAEGHPNPPPGSRPQRLLAAGAGIGIAMCLIYALTIVAVVPLVTANNLLALAAAAVATPLVCTGWLLLILPRLYYLGGSALHQLGTPITAITAAAAGTLLLQNAYTAALPHNQILWEAHGGGALVAVGCVLLFSHTSAARLIAIPLAGAIGALAFTVTTYQLAAAAYITCTGLWWLARTAAITRDAYPRLGRPSSRHPITAPASRWQPDPLKVPPDRPQTTTPTGQTPRNGPGNTRPEEPSAGTAAQTDGHPPIGAPGARSRPYWLNQPSGWTGTDDDASQPVA